VYTEPAAGRIQDAFGRADGEVLRRRLTSASGTSIVTFPVSVRAAERVGQIQQA
jgi:hypothetical protein